MNIGMLPETSGCAGDHRLLGQHLARALGALVRLGQDGVERRRHALDAARGRRGVAQRGQGGGRRAAGTAPAAPRRSPAAVERRVSGVPPAPSTAGATACRTCRARGAGAGWSRGANSGGGAWGIYGAGRGGGQLGRTNRNGRLLTPFQCVRSYLQRYTPPPCKISSRRHAAL